ncbi:MAG: hypothetical protein M1835_005731 [Candelina submexicana]|nr:MAG: hypothetical protein M1835_005731 [Candelina submexicana]
MAGPRRPPPTTGSKAAELRAQTNELLVKANAHLSNRQPQAALHIYTTVLSKTSPAHPIAFLNRALAYLDLNFPELASSDAHKAKVAIQDIRDKFQGGFRSPGLQNLISYSRVCEQAADTGIDWATEPTCYLRGDLMDVEAASIVLDICTIRKVEKHEKTYVLLYELEAKASYRIALGLWKIGGGARMDALGTLSKGRRSIDNTSEDRDALDDLGNSILEDMSQEFFAEDRVAKDKGLESREEKEAFQMTGTRGQNRHQQSLIKRELYNENTFEPDLEGKGVPKALIDGMRSMTNNVQLQVVPSQNEKLSQLVLVAMRDIYPGELVLEERSPLYVTTASLDSDTNLYCDTCATMMLVSRSHVKRAGAETHALPGYYDPNESPTEKNTSVGSSFNTDDISDAEDPLILSQDVRMTKGLSPPLSPPSSHTVSAQGPSPPSAQIYSKPVPWTPSAINSSGSPCLCSTCGIALYCSQDCLSFAKSEFHSPLCDSVIEDRIRAQTLMYAVQKRATKGLRDSKGWTEPEEQCLRGLLLARILAIAVKTGRHPLEIDQVRFLGGGEWKARDLSLCVNYSSEEEEEKEDEEDMDWCSNACNSEKSCFGSLGARNGKESESEKDMPWSFALNVEIPLDILSRMNANPLNDLSRFDGWVVNTLMAKIERSMRVTEGARCVRVYGEQRKGIGGGCGGKDGERVWVGSLHPVFSLVGREEEGSGLGKGNVVVKEVGKGVIRCFAVATEKGEQITTTTSGGNKGNGNGNGIHEPNNADEKMLGLSFRSANDLLLLPTSQPTPKPAIKKGDLLILKPNHHNHDNNNNNVPTTILRSDPSISSSSNNNGRTTSGVQSWLSSIKEAGGGREGVKVLDGSGKVEEQSFYDGVVGARDGALGWGNE